MRTSTKVIRVGVVVPAGLTGSFVAVIGLGFLPDAGLVLAFLGTLVAALVLACGRLEAAATRLFGFARGPRPGQRAVLEPTLALLEKVGLAPGRVLVRVTDTDGLPATWIGRDTVIVEPWLVQNLYQRRLTTTDAATVVAHAVASQRIGPSRFDLAARLWALPWTMVFVISRQIARACSWVPAGGFAWHLRIVMGVIGVYQGFRAGGNPTLGVATGVLVTISYIAPAADRNWRAVVERDADLILARRGLGDPLIQFVQWRQRVDSMERAHRIRGAAVSPLATLAAAQAPAASPPIDARMLAHPSGVS